MFEEIARLYHDLDQGMQPISGIFPHLPIAVHRTRDRSGTALLIHGSPGLVWLYLPSADHPAGAGRHDLHLCMLCPARINSVVSSRLLPAGHANRWQRSSKRSLKPGEPLAQRRMMCSR